MDVEKDSKIFTSKRNTKLAAAQVIVFGDWVNNVKFVLINITLFIKHQRRNIQLVLLHMHHKDFLLGHSFVHSARCSGYNCPGVKLKSVVHRVSVSCQLLKVFPKAHFEMKHFGIYQNNIIT